MRRTSWLAVLVLGSGLSGAATAFSGCGVSPAVTVVHLGPGEKGDAIRGDSLKLKRSGQEAFAGLRGGYYVVRNLDDWRAAWPTGAEPTLPITLDTTRSMLLLAAADKKGIVDLHIERVVETADHIHVWVRETTLGKNCADKQEHAPFDAVVAPRVDKPVKFYVDDVSAESCGEAPGVSVQCRVNDAPGWVSKAVAQPGDKVDCEMSAASRGKFALIDNVLSLGELPAGSSTKLLYAKGPGRGTFAIDVFGAYSVRAEASDEMGRKSSAVATIDALPPKTKDVLVQLVWTNFDVSDDPETFPRVKLRALEPDANPRIKAMKECSLDNPRPELCDVKGHSAYTHMTLKASGRRIPLEVAYTDERIDKGPLVCVQLFFDGARTAETCDRKHRDPDERWQVGIVDMESGHLVDSMTVVADAGVDSGGADGGAADAGAKKPVPTPAKK